MSNSDAVREYFVNLGRRYGAKAGSVKSERKRQASRENLAKAFEKRFPGRPVPATLRPVAEGGQD
jgi:hypothetical protein